MEIKYKNYTANVEYDAEANIFHGSVSNIVDVVTFQTASADELAQEFAVSVDGYEAMCAEEGERAGE